MFAGRGAGSLVGSTVLLTCTGMPFHAAYNKAISEWQARVDAAQQRIAGLQATITAKQAELAAKQKELDALQSGLGRVIDAAVAAGIV